MHTLLCPPEFYRLEYEINPWMDSDDSVDSGLAHRQWQQLRNIYNELGWQVELIKPVAHLPDMVFATDSCLIINGKVLLSHFRFAQRQPEVEFFQTWLRDHGYTTMRQAQNFFEGGDNLICGDKILAGHGFRSDAAASAELQEFFDRQVISLKLVDPRFFHLDTAVAILSDNTVAFYPGALDKTSQELLRQTIPNVIEATLEEAKSFGLNVVSDGHNVVTSDASASLLQKYRNAGFKVIGTNIDEFKKAGGGVKCMTLELRTRS